MVGGGHPRHPVAVGMADDDGFAAAELLHHLGDVAGEVVQRDLGHWPGAASDAARLRPQDTEARRRQSLRDLVVIVGVARERRKQHDGGSAAIDHHVDLNVVVVNQFAAPLRGGCDGHAAERETGGQKQRPHRGHRHGCLLPIVGIDL